MKYQPAEEHREHRLKAQKYRSHRRLGILLTENLKCISNSAAHYTGIEQRNDNGKDILNIRLFKYKHTNRRYRAGDKELCAGKSNVVDLLTKIIDNENMHCKAYGAKQGDYFARSNGKAALFDAQKIQTDNTQSNAYPYLRARFFSEEKPENGHHDHIHGGYKADLARIEIIEGVLLKIACNTKRNTAANTADDNILKREALCFAGGQSGFFFLKRHEHRRYKHERTDKGTQSVKGEGADASALTLCNKRQSPNNGGKNTIKRTENFSLFDKKSPSNDLSDKNRPQQKPWAAKFGIIRQLLPRQLLQRREQPLPRQPLPQRRAR